MVLKAILLDLDGTLIDSIPLITKSVDKTITHFGYKVSKQKLRELSQLHSRDIGYYLMDSNKTSFDIHEFVEYRRLIFLKLLKKQQKQWFKDSKSFLEKESKKYKVAIVTGSRWQFINAVFDKQVMKNIDFIITSDDVEHKKPDIEPIEKTLKKLKLKKEEIVFIGDSTQDGQMCQRYGVKFIAKTTGIPTEYQLKKYNPILIAKNFSQIEEYLWV
jgi:HAD superfamily hydrolase (TIGR01549 family)